MVMTVMQSTRAARQAGYTIMETIVVVGVASVILAGLWAAAAALDESSRVRRSTEQVVAVMTNFRNYAVGQPLGNPAAGNSLVDYTRESIRANILPVDMYMHGSDQARHPWSTQPGSAKTYVQYASKGIALEFNSLTRQQCVRFATEAQKRDGIVTTTVNARTRNNALYGPLTTEELMAYCVEGSTNLVRVMFSLNN